MKQSINPKLLKLWLRKLQMRACANHKDEIDDFHDHLNADIQFTKEIEENGKLPFPVLS